MTMTASKKAASKPSAKPAKPTSTKSTRSTSKADRTYDAIVVGGGHNGLVNGAYLAKSGLKTLIIERRHLVGGAAITEELRPGFWFTTFSYALSLLRPDIIQDLELTKHGFMPLLMSTTFAPDGEGDYLLFTQDHAQNQKEIARHSKHDADAYDQYSHDMEMVCQAIKPLLDMVPPDIFSDDPEELIALASLGSRFKKLDKRVLHNAVRLLTGSAADFLDDYFESDLLKGYLASSSIIGTKVGPRSQGSGLVLLYHSIGEHDGEFGSWAFHKKGNGGFTQVLKRAAESFGAEIILESPVDSVITKDGKATGVALADGTEYYADTVVSALDPRRTFLELVNPRELPDDLVENIQRFRFQGTSSKVNFALDGLPKYPALGDRGDQFRGFTNIGPSMDYLERAFDDAKYGWYSQNPYIDMAIQSTIDADMAPPGKHVMSCFIQYTPYHLRESDWDTEKENLGRHGPANAGEVLPGLRRSRDPARGGHAAPHRADGRAQRGQHLRRRVLRPADVLLPPGAGLVAVPDPDRRLLPVRLGHASGRLRHGRAGQARRRPDPQGPGQGKGPRLGPGARRARPCHHRGSSGSSSSTTSLRTWLLEQLSDEDLAFALPGNPPLGDLLRRDRRYRAGLHRRVPDAPARRGSRPTGIRDSGAASPGCRPGTPSWTPTCWRRSRPSPTTSSRLGSWSAATASRCRSAGTSTRTARRCSSSAATPTCTCGRWASTAASTGRTGSARAGAPSVPASHPGTWKTAGSPQGDPPS